MRFYSTKVPLDFLYFAITTIFILISCNKDSDLFRTTINPDTATSIEEEDSDDTSTKEEEKEDETVEETVEEIEDEVTEDILEDRTTSFPAINDAHFQSGKGFNQNIIRLEEGNRTSYLMFDLGAIDSIEGQITDVTLQFTISGDDGSGNIKVFKGVSNDWTEEDLVTTSVPNLGSELGSITKEYTIGTTEEISLDITEIAAETNTLILNHQDGNDLAFASKEHASKSGPKLVVGYKASIESEEIIPLVTEDEPEETAENSEAQNQGPMAVADGTPTEGEAPHEVTFTGSGSSDDKKINSYSWDFKDGEKSTEADPKHSFTEIGTYEVLLTVKDEEGLANTDTVVITVTDIVNTAPVALVSATPKSGEAPLLVAFKGSNSTDDIGIRSYAWDFKDGDTATNADPKHTFTEVGTYEVVLKVTDEKDLSNSKDIIITVTEPKNEAPVAVVSANKTSGNAPLSVQFNGDKSTDDSGIATYEWDFQDAASSTDENPSYTFTKTGSYAVALTVKDGEGLSSKKTLLITVEAEQNEAPKAVARPNISSGQVPLTIDFRGDQSTDDKGITAYAWDFKDGSTSIEANPSHTFENPGTYQVELIVYDGNGATDTDIDKIIVSASTSPSPDDNDPQRVRYLATNGNSSNDGKSPSQPWSLDHALNIAKAGDVFYVKAGNYGNRQLLSRNDASSGSPIRFVGYRNTPGDIVSNQGSTHNYGDEVSASRMPLLNGTPGQGTAITVYHKYYEFENFQITGYQRAVLSIDRASHLSFKNIIASKIGLQSGSSYNGFGFNVQSDYTIIENCFIYNAAAEAINLADSDYSLVNYTKVYSDNFSNPTDYYFVLTSGTNNTIVQNSYAERIGNLSHPGHGFDMKDLAEYNTFKNCIAKNTTFELNFTGVKNNTIDGGKLIGTGASNPSEASVQILNGANNNTIKNMTIENVQKAITWKDNNDGFVGPGGDRDAASMGYNNTFDRLTIRNVDRILNVGFATNSNVKASGNTFTNCNFSNFDSVALVYNRAESTVFRNCTFTNGDDLVIEAQGQHADSSYFGVSWQNCTWTSVNFNPPN